MDFYLKICVLKSAENCGMTIMVVWTKIWKMYRLFSGSVNQWNINVNVKYNVRVMPVAFTVEKRYSECMCAWCSIMLNVNLLFIGCIGINFRDCQYCLTIMLKTSASLQRALEFSVPEWTILSHRSWFSHPWQTSSMYP